MSRRVVITGLGTVNPLGNNVETTWDNVKKGVCGIDEITRIDTTNHAVKLAGEVKNLDSRNRQEGCQTYGPLRTVCSCCS
jgi:3-oxoacyl-[acyl-carrier-protein] synthase II